MPSEARLNLKKKKGLIYVSKGVIWASEYSLGPQIWGSGGGPAPPGSATDVKTSCERCFSPGLLPQVLLLR